MPLVKSAPPVGGGTLNGVVSPVPAKAGVEALFVRPVNVWSPAPRGVWVIANVPVV
jgi:hypothetical protein